MSDAVCRAIAGAASGYVDAPAGCGKTESIVKTVGHFCDNPQLVLTHTHAGVGALRQRFRDKQTPSRKCHVDTIAGWAWGWVRKYPINAGYGGNTGIAEWNEVYGACANLLEKDFVRQGVLNSYSGVIVDEYQDCTLQMHRLIVQLKRILPCRVLGDELQGIFDFGKDLVSWADVRAEFAQNLGALDTPHRWINAQNERLGRWLLGSRAEFLQNREPSYAGSPIDHRSVTFRELSSELIQITHNRQGRICVIGAKAHPFKSSVETALVNQGYRVLEPSELSALQKVVIALADGSAAVRNDTTVKFLLRAHGGLEAADKEFIQKILTGTARQPRRADRRALWTKHPNGATPALVYDILCYIEKCGGACDKLRESLSALRCILEQHQATATDLKTLYADEITKRKYHSRSKVFRCIGSTLLVKGLEFDHVVIVRSSDWLQSWGNHRDLYVALTRGCKTTTLLELVA